MELEAITRQEQIIAGKDLQPVTRMEFFLKAYGGGGSGGGVQPDLNQNDSTAADYVKNRTHYEESIYTDYVLNSGGTQITGFSMPEVGETVTVKINGVESADTVKTGTSSVIGSYKYIGTIDFDSLRAGGTGWLIAEVMGQASGFANPDTTISVESTIVHKINDKFINFDGLVRTFDYHFKGGTIYKSLYIIRIYERSWDFSGRKQGRE